jgi:hypothetical protein
LQLLQFAFQAQDSPAFRGLGRSFIRKFFRHPVTAVLNSTIMVEPYTRPSPGLHGRRCWPS